MADELTLSELKERAKNLGFTNIQREAVTAQVVPLASWNGVSSEVGDGFTRVAVCYVLDGDTVTVRKARHPDLYYILS